MSNDVPLVSAIIPCRNETSWIAKCLESIIDNDYPKDRIEVFVVDGMSNDGTRAVVESYDQRYPFIRLLENPKKTAPAALNIGIATAQGEVIMRMDAHNEYPANYISGLVGWLEKSGADNVGGLWITRPSEETPMAQAIAIGLSHPLGVGNAYYRTGVRRPRWVDTVPFGCYRREVFDRIGVFDEELVRNQDDEFNLRLQRHGGRILLVPEVTSVYYARGSLGKLCQMNYQYGYFKPLVVRKVGRIMTLRQLVPAMLILALAATALGAFVSWIALAIFAGILFAYSTIILACSASAALKHGVRCALDLCVVFPVIHFSYGWGYLKGVLEFLILRRSDQSRLKTTPLSR